MSIKSSKDVYRELSACPHLQKYLQQKVPEPQIRCSMQNNRRTGCRLSLPSLRNIPDEAIFPSCKSDVPHIIINEPGAGSACLLAIVGRM